MNTNSARLKPEGDHTLETVFPSFTTCAKTFPNRQAAVTQAECLAKDAVNRLFPERRVNQAQALAKVLDGADPKSPAQIKEAAWRKRLSVVAADWTERASLRLGSDLSPDDRQPWLPVEVLELACLEGYVIREVRPDFDGAGGVFPSCSEQAGFPRAELSTPQTQPSTKDSVYA